ncbi:hypothetical protein [Archangium lipolyticum]|uniref:hypothetical protein n=1 Tax=Archangium lipolyticum TaxID=2970465 RepID=UPI00214A2C6A|nr:hypothetical protein [Archangium lipolyticum]
MPDDNRAKIDKLNALVARLRGEYASDPNVRTIGWGLKRSKGSLQDVLSIIFYVKSKLPSERAIASAGSHPIPEELEGYPTDVEEVRPGTQSAGQRDDRQFDPLVGGPATSNAEEHLFWFNGSGTLGMLVRDASTNAPMALSNWHVWADGGDEGDDIIQPGHPTAGDHLEGVGKVLACGPLLSTVIEWEAPSPLAGGLYGGAAAAAVAAAASDYRDPIRRGQDQTTPDPGERTLREEVEMAIEYPQLPLPGRPFHTQVRWHYQRHTERRVLEHTVKEERVNSQFLLGKMIVTDRGSYKPGDVVNLTAAVWDYQPRPCDAYHVVAHLLPHNRPGDALRVVLHPTTCPSSIHPFPPEDDDQQRTCLDFARFSLGEYPSKGAFNWLTYLSQSQEPVRIVNWYNNTPALAIPAGSLRLSHIPTNRVTARVVQFTSTPVTMAAYNASGQSLGQTTAPNVQGVEHVLELGAEGIVGVVLRGGGGEGVLLEYCVHGGARTNLSNVITESIATGLALELPDLKQADRRLRAKRCCYTGSIRLPPTEKQGKWDVHLVVQNVNHVPEGTPPEQAATVIGGHVLSAHAAPDLVGCGVIMLLDHVFDVI